MKKILTIIILINILIINCENKKKFINKIIEEKNKFDKYEDEYKKNKYLNKSLGLIIEFDEDWIIIPKYNQLNNFQKKYARFLSSDEGEVLFIGYNDKRKIGIRAICEEKGIDNAEYLEKLKTDYEIKIKKYEIDFIKEEDEILKNLKVYRSIFETKINEANIFIFDSVLFKKEIYILKIDLWINKNYYESEEEYINSIFNTIDLVNPEDIIDKPIEDN